jgi:hypothetical protein
MRRIEKAVGLVPRMLTRLAAFNDSARQAGVDTVSSREDTKSPKESTLSLFRNNTETPPPQHDDSAEMTTKGKLRSAKAVVEAHGLHARHYPTILRTEEYSNWNEYISHLVHKVARQVITPGNVKSRYELVEEHIWNDKFLMKVWKLGLSKQTCTGLAGAAVSSKVQNLRKQELAKANNAMASASSKPLSLSVPMIASCPRRVVGHPGFLGEAQSSTRIATPNVSVRPGSMNDTTTTEQSKVDQVNTKKAQASAEVPRTSSVLRSSLHLPPTQLPSTLSSDAQIKLHSKLPAANLSKQSLAASSARSSSPTIARTDVSPRTSITPPAETPTVIAAAERTDIPISKTPTAIVAKPAIERNSMTSTKLTPTHVWSEQQNAISEQTRATARSHFDALIASYFPEGAGARYSQPVAAKVAEAPRSLPSATDQSYIPRVTPSDSLEIKSPSPLAVLPPKTAQALPTNDRAQEIGATCGDLQNHEYEWKSRRKVTSSELENNLATAKESRSLKSPAKRPREEEEGDLRIVRSINEYDDTSPARTNLYLESPLKKHKLEISEGIEQQTTRGTPMDTPELDCLIRALSTTGQLQPDHDVVISITGAPTRESIVSKIAETFEFNRLAPTALLFGFVPETNVILALTSSTNVRGWVKLSSKPAHYDLPTIFLVNAPCDKVNYKLEINHLRCPSAKRK